MNNASHNQVGADRVAQTDELFTVEQAADYLGVTIGWLHQLRGAGRGPLSTRRGRRLQYRRVDLDAYLVREREASMRGGKL